MVMVRLVRTTHTAAVVAVALGFDAVAYGLDP
jgi:hypothetical protein